MKIIPPKRVISLSSITLASLVLVLVAGTESQAEHGGIDGCSFPVGRSYIWNITFRSACIQHDICYRTIGKTRSKCDKDFRSDMTKICAFRSPSPQCFNAVNTYYMGVRAGGHQPYRQAQTHLRRDAKMSDRRCFTISAKNTGTALTKGKTNQIECILKNYHGYNWGSHNRQTASCPLGMFAAGFRLKIEGRQGGNDDTALNSIQLACKRPGEALPIIYSDDPYGQPVVTHVSNEIGKQWGRYSLWAFCPDDSFIAGYRTKYEDHQGDGHLDLPVGSGGGQDDTGANAFEAKCRSIDGQREKNIKVNIEGSWGTWDEWITAPKGWFTTKVVANVEPSQGSGDDTAMNMIWLKLRQLPSARLPGLKPVIKNPGSKDLNLYPIN